MNRDYLGSVIKGNYIGGGMFSDVYTCDYHYSFFAYKEYIDIEEAHKYISYIKDNLYKLSEFYQDKDYLLPYKFIYKNPNSELFRGYILDYLYEYNTLNKLEGVDKIKLLLRARDLIEKLHKEYGFIHGDISTFNFMFNNTSDDLRLIDFDNVINIKHPGEIDLSYYHDYVYEYSKHNKIDKDLDIFLFNITCFAVINNVPYDDVLDLIFQKNYKNITNENAIKILESYKDLGSKTLKKEYIIDYLK